MSISRPRTIFGWTLVSAFFVGALWYSRQQENGVQRAWNHYSGNNNNNNYNDLNQLLSAPYYLLATSPGYDPFQCNSDCKVLTAAPNQGVPTSYGAQPTAFFLTQNNFNISSDPNGNPIPEPSCYQFSFATPIQV